MAHCTWGFCPGTHKCGIDCVADDKGIITHTETLAIGTFTFTTPAPPSWAPNDKELWDLTHKENISKFRQKAYEIYYEGRLDEKTKEVQVLKDSFAAFDTDGSGCLDHDEVLSILTRVGGGNPMSKDDAEDFIKMFDVNGDGKMQLAEFIDAMKALAGMSDMDAKEDAEEIAEMLVDDVGLKVLQAGKIGELEEHKETTLAHGETW